MLRIIISALFYRIYAKTRKKRSVNFNGVIMKSQVIAQVVVSYMLLFVHFLTNFEQKELDFISFPLFSWLFKQQNLVTRTLCKLTKQSENTIFSAKGLDFDHFSLGFMTLQTPDFSYYNFGKPSAFTRCVYCSPISIWLSPSPKLIC